MSSEVITVIPWQQATPEQRQIKPKPAPNPLILKIAETHLNSPVASEQQRDEVNPLSKFIEEAVQQLKSQAAINSDTDNLLKKIKNLNRKDLPKLLFDMAEVDFLLRDSNDPLFISIKKKFGPIFDSYRKQNNKGETGCYIAGMCMRYKKFTDLFINTDNIHDILINCAKLENLPLFHFVFKNKPKDTLITQEILTVLKHFETSVDFSRWDKSFSRWEKFKSCKRDVLNELFDVEEETQKKLAWKHPEDFAEWCQMENRTGLMELHFKDIYKKGSVEDIFSYINFLEKSSDDRCAKKIERAFKVLLNRNEDPLLVIDCLLKRKGMLIRKNERLLLMKLKRDMPHLNKALISYELLKRKTEQRDLRQLPIEEIQLSNQTFRLHKLSHDEEFQFFVHGVSFEEEPEEYSHLGPIGSIKKDRLRNGYLCTSLISNQVPDYFKYKSAYAMVLSVDPRNIVATTREDAYTPYSPNRYTNPLAVRYYQYYQRLQLLTSYIDHLYRESGIQAEGLTDDFQTLNRLMSLQMTEPTEERSIRIKELRRKAFSKDPDHCESYIKNGITSFQLNALIRHYAQQPESPIKNTLARCQILLSRIQEDHTEFNHHIHPVIGTGELLSQTPFQLIHNYNCLGDRPFNQVDLDLMVKYREDDFVPVELENSETDPIPVQAILIHREALKMENRGLCDVLNDAQRKNIPILLIDDPVLPLSSALQKLARAVDSGNLKAIEILLSNQPQIKDEDVGEVLVKALQKNKFRCFAKIFELRPNISDKRLQEISEVAIENNTQLHHVVAVFLKHNKLVPPAIAGRALVVLAQHYDHELANKLLFSGAEIGEEDQRAAIQIAKKYPHLSYFVHEQQAAWAFDCVLEDLGPLNEDTLGSLCNNSAFANYITNEQVARAIKVAIEKGCTTDVIKDLINLHPQNKSINMNIAISAIVSRGDAYRVLSFVSQIYLTNEIAEELLERIIDQDNLHMLILLHNKYPNYFPLNNSVLEKAVTGNKQKIVDYFSRPSRKLDERVKGAYPP